MGRTRFSKTTVRFANAPLLPCVYAVELIRRDETLIKVGAASNSLGRMISLRSEVKRFHGADLGRIAIFTKPTVKAAYEAETKVVNAISEMTKPIDGRREFFGGVSFDDACSIVCQKTNADNWTEV